MYASKSLILESAAAKKCCIYILNGFSFRSVVSSFLPASARARTVVVVIVIYTVSPQIFRVLPQLPTRLA